MDPVGVATIKAWFLNGITLLFLQISAQSAMIGKLVLEGKMMCDIAVKFDSGRFRLRGVGVIIKNDRVLDLNDEGLEWLSISGLSNYRVYPQIYNAILKELPTEIVHFVVDER